MDTIKRIIIAGGRDFNNFDYFKTSIETVINEDDDIEIISGHASGADSYAEEYAKSNGIPFKVFPADWKRYRRAAGPIRNRQMLDYANEKDSLLIAFWDGKSKGTMDMINKAKLEGIPIEVFSY